MASSDVVDTCKCTGCPNVEECGRTADVEFCGLPLRRKGQHQNTLRCNKCTCYKNACWQQHKSRWDRCKCPVPPEPATDARALAAANPNAAYPAVGGSASSAGPCAAPPGLGIDVNGQLQQIHQTLGLIMQRLDVLEASAKEKEETVVGTPIVPGQFIRKA